MDRASNDARPSVIVVDDNADFAKAISRLLRPHVGEIRVANSVGEAKEALEERSSDVALVDYFLPDGTGAEFVRWGVSSRRVKVAYGLTGDAGTDNVVDAMRAGCSDVLEKPIDLATLKRILADAMKSASSDSVPPDDDLPEELALWRREYAPSILGEAPPLVQTIDVISKVAETPCTVLITGASGTGKELVARSLHNASRRADQPFVAINCAAIPHDLLESEMFGHAKGAFTGATAKREGRFELADGGTIFLDEIGELDLRLQGKLLRAVQEQEFTPVGESQPRRVDVRVIAATNRDLQQMCRNGEFRDDLYYRLNVVPVTMPSLAERRGDVAILTRHFVDRANEMYGRDVAGIDAEAAEQLAKYDWPGNIRELENLISRLVILHPARGAIIGAAALPPEMQATAESNVRELRAGLRPADVLQLPDDGVDLNATISGIETKLISQALERSGGNKAHAARLLNIKRTTLVERLKKIA